MRINVTTIVGMLLIALTLVPDLAWAEVNTCNYSDSGENPLEFSGQGLIQPVMTQIVLILDDAWEALYEGIIANDTFIRAIQAIIVLYIMIYGLLFTLGMVQQTAGEVMMRLIKITIVGILISGTGQQFFTDYVYSFFRGGQDFIIYHMTNTMAEVLQAPGGNFTGDQFVIGTLDPAGTGPITTPSGTTVQQGPFTPIDLFLSDIISPSTIPIFEAAMTEGAQGPAYLFIYVLLLFFLLGVVAKTLWIYLVSILALSLLFGLAPIFCSCLLFQQTRHLFDGWLGQCINFTLQPVLCFTFIAFFLILMDFAVTDILDIHVCYCEKPLPLAQFEGSPEDTKMWCFVDAAGVPLSLDMDFGGYLDELGNPDSSVEFPIEIADLLTALLLAYTGYHFIDFAVQMAQDFSGSWISAEQGSPITQTINMAGSKASSAFGTLMSGGSLEQAFNPKGANTPSSPRTGPGGNVAHNNAGTAADTTLSQKIFEHQGGAPVGGGGNAHNNKT